MTASESSNRDKTRQPKNRNPWIAGLLSFLCPGLGQFYNAELSKAWKWFTAAALLLIAAQVSPTLTSETGLFLSLTCLFALLVVKLASVIAAFRSARRKRKRTLTRINHPLTYLLFVLAAAFVGDLLLPDKGLPYGHFSIPSGSMLPNIQRGEHIIAYRPGQDRYQPDYGDIVVYLKPNTTDIYHLKRVVGLPGDQVQMIDGVLYLNGEPTSVADGETVIPGQFPQPAKVQKETLPNGRNYQILSTGEGLRLDNTPVTIVPADHYFVLGDNRDNSLDSRVPPVGMVPAERILYKAALVIWSPELTRLGKRISTQQ